MGSSRSWFGEGYQFVTYFAVHDAVSQTQQEIGSSVRVKATKWIGSWQGQILHVLESSVTGPTVLEQKVH